MIALVRQRPSLRASVVSYTATTLLSVSSTGSLYAFPNNTAAAACSMSAAAAGAFSRFETTTLLTAKEAEAAMTQANKTKSEYKPPHS